MKNLAKYLLLSGLLLISSCNNIETKNDTKEVAKQGRLDAPPKPGSIDYLIYKNGFKIFKLGESINKYSKYIKPIHGDNGKKYEVIDPKFLTIGDDIKIDKIILWFSKKSLAGIKVVVDEPYKIKFYSALKAAYGNPGALNMWSVKGLLLSYHEDYESEQGKTVANFLGLSSERKK